jgi:hypothetical protein
MGAFRLKTRVEWVVEFGNNGTNASFWLLMPALGWPSALVCALASATNAFALPSLAPGYAAR